MRRWQIFGAVALRKFPEILPRMDPIHSKIQEVFSTYEVAKSKLSKHELQHIEETRIKDEDESEIQVTETAQDKLDRWTAERAKFKVGVYDQRQTLVQYLFVKGKFGSDPNEKWLLPQTEFNPNLDEHLMDTARRVLFERFNIRGGFTIPSRIPSSVFTYKYPKEIAARTKFDGAKVFFIKAQLDGPDKAVKLALNLIKPSEAGRKKSSQESAENVPQSDIENRIKWVTRAESENLVECKDYIRTFSLGLFHENTVDTNRVMRKATIYAVANYPASQRQVSQ